VPLFAGLLKDDKQFEEFVNYLRPARQRGAAQSRRGDFPQGDPADHFYMVRIGFVKVSQERPGGTQVLNYIGPGGHFGEIGLLSDLPEVRDLAPAGVRTATCTALDHVDVVRVRAEDFRFIAERFPNFAPRAGAACAGNSLREDEKARRQVEKVPLGDFCSRA